jgi:hypothetical protein
MIPTRPETRNSLTPAFAFDPHLFKSLEKVAKAASTAASRIWVNDDALKPIYIEVDTPARLLDSHQPRWVVVFMPVKLEPGETYEPEGE